MTEEKRITFRGVRSRNPKLEDDLESTEAVFSAPDLSVQLEVNRGEKFEMQGQKVDWWLFVTSLKSGDKGYIPSTCVVPLRDDLTAQEELELERGVDLTTSYLNTTVDMKFFPDAPIERDVANRQPCPEEKANPLSLLTFWWNNWLIYIGYKRPLTDADMWALSTVNKSAHVVPKLEKAWNKETKRCDTCESGKNEECAEEPVDAEAVKLKPADDANVEFAPPTKKEPCKKASLTRAMFHVFWARFIFSGFLKFSQDILVFAQPYLLRLVMEYTSEESTKGSWEGYIYALLMLLSATVQSLIIQQYFWSVMRLGMRIRTAILGIVYAKALSLNNASRRESTAGEMVNLMSVDAQRLMDLTGYIHYLWSCPLQIVISIGFLYEAMGVSILAGVAVMVLLIPINTVMSKMARKLQVKMMHCKDSRIKMMNEILSGIKVLKLYAWEKSFLKQIFSIREGELKYLRSAAYLNAGFSFTFSCAPFLVSLATFTIYVLIGNELTATKAFVAISLFNILRFPIMMLPNVVTSTIQASVSVGRLTDFLNLDELDPSNVQKSMPEHVSNQVIHVEDGVFTWDRDEKPILSNVNMNVNEASLVAVVGQVGCGKSTLLSALLGETEKLGGQVYVKGTVAFVPQQAWIQNATLRDNILFGRSFDGKRYCKVVKSCALSTDLDMLPGGDMTEIGEKGINLSGGQKQRVSLARAVYFNADVYLFDDPLSAVDSHVGKHIFDKVIGPRGVLRHKTRVLVTHSINFLPQVDQIIVLQDGRISEMGTYSELLENQGAFAEYLKTYASDQQDSEAEAAIPEHVRQMLRQDSVVETRGSMEGMDSEDFGRVPSLQRLDIPARKLRRRGSMVSTITSDTADTDCHFAGEDSKDVDRMVEDEKSKTGRVQTAVFFEYMKSIKLFVAILFLASLVLSEACLVYSRIWLAEWSSTNVTSTKQRDLYLGVYGGLGCAQALFVLLSSVLLALGSMRASRHLHGNMLNNVIRSPMAFFETTPLGRIVNRFSKDLYTVDDMVPRSLSMFLSTFLNVVSTMFAISFATPIILVVIVPLGIVYIFIQRVYIGSARQLKRIESVSRSPVYNYFLETINGTSTIRAFSQQSRFIHDNYYKVDENQVAYFPTLSTNRWLALRLDFVGNILVFFAALFAVISRDSLDPGLVGMSVTYALQVTATLNWMVRMSSELETNIVAVERVKEYSDMPTEAALIIPDNRPPDDWPQEGNISVEDFDLKYREGLPLVLKNINCQFKPGEKIGIVGRTGAGKSTLTLALFRLLERAGGKIVVDGIDISSIGLEDLRSRLTIIPQDPVLFSGTLRTNLDPFEKYSDDELWHILELSHLKKFVSGLKEGLLHPVAEEGENLSVGQRQLVCLARALLRHSKVLVLDEATAAVDLETDELIQQTIRREFADRTVLTIAHRLNTIMDYNRILVLDKGFMIEFDTPNNLLAQRGIFYSMAHDAGLA